MTTQADLDAARSRYFQAEEVLKGIAVMAPSELPPTPDPGAPEMEFFDTGRERGLYAAALPARQFLEGNGVIP